MKPSPGQTVWKIPGFPIASSRSGFFTVLYLLHFISIKAAPDAVGNPEQRAVRGEVVANSLPKQKAISIDHAGHVHPMQESSTNARTIRNEILTHNNVYDTAPRPRSVKKTRTAVSAVLQVEKLEPVDSTMPMSSNITFNSTNGSHVFGAHEAMVLQSTVAFCTYIAGIVVMIGVTVGIYSERGIGAIIIILTYIISLSSMTLTIRNLFVSTSFDFPRWVSASHFLCTFIVGFMILSHNRAREGTPIVLLSPSQFLSSILPVAIALSSSIGFANLGLLHANAHFYEMVGATTPLATAGLHVILGKAFSVRLVPPCLLIAFGLVICTYYETAFSWTGFGFCSAAVLCRAIKSLVQNILMQGEVIRTQLEPLELLVWTSLPCALIMASWSLVQEGREPYYLVLQSTETAVALLYTILNACILNTSALYVLRDLGPLAQQVAVQLKGVLAILGSVWLFNEFALMNQIGGYMCMVVGIYWYNRREYTMKWQHAPDSRDGQAVPSAAPGAD